MYAGCRGGSGRIAQDGLWSHGGFDDCDYVSVPEKPGAGGRSRLCDADGNAADGNIFFFCADSDPYV